MSRSNINKDLGRIAPPGTSGSSGATGQGESAGRWQGETLTHLKPADQPGVKTSLIRMQRAQRMGLGSANAAHTAQAAHKELSSRTLRGEHQPAPLPPARLALAQRQSGDANAIRRLGGQLLRGGRLPPRDGTRRTTLKSYLAARSAASMFDDDADADDALALLTPLNQDEGDGPPPDNMEQLHELLRDVGESDRGKLAKVLEGLDRDVDRGLHSADFAPLPRDPDALYHELRQFWGNKAALADRLRRAQGLPLRRDDESVARLRQAINDAASGLESDERSLIFGSLNAAQAAERTAAKAVAGKAADPERFLDAYVALIAVGEGGTAGTEHFDDAIAAKQFAVMLEHFSAEELRSGALDAIRQALTDDLDAATRSRDTVYLAATVLQIRNLAGLTTLTETADKLAKSINRMHPDKAMSDKSDTSDPTLDATSLLRIVVGMLSSDYPSRMQVESLIRRLALQQGTMQINVIQGLLNVVRSLPLYVFKSDDDRLATIAALREVLEAAIDEEEDQTDDGAVFNVLPVHPTMQ